MTNVMSALLALQTSKFSTAWWNSRGMLNNPTDPSNPVPRKLYFRFLLVWDFRSRMTFWTVRTSHYVCQRRRMKVMIRCWKPLISRSASSRSAPAGRRWTACQRLACNWTISFSFSISGTRTAKSLNGPSSELDEKPPCSGEVLAIFARAEPQQATGNKAICK